MSLFFLDIYIQSPRIIVKLTYLTLSTNKNEGNYLKQNVRSNTRYVHIVVAPSAAQQLKSRLRPHRGVKGCGDCTIVCVGF